MNQELLKAPPPRLRDEYDLDEFVRGSENELAVSAVQKVLGQPGAESHNPLYLYGPGGSGRTHLMYGLRVELERRHPQWNILALPAGEFIHECDQAWQRRESSELRQQLWRLDAVLIDDIHLFAKHPAAMEELYHIYNRLVADNRQLVVTADCGPRRLVGLSMPLKLRLLSGLVVPTVKPDRPLLRQILDRRAARLRLDLAEPAAAFLCECVRNVSELLGVLTTVRGKRRGKARAHPVELDEIKQVYEHHAAERLTVAEVAKLVCEHYRADLTRVRSASRRQELVQPRQMAMYLARELTNCSLTRIGRYFGGRDHTTVLYGLRKVGDRIAADPAAAQLAKDLRDRIQSG